jgi:glycosyltransferase involved in cell wall biosynthesis
MNGSSPSARPRVLMVTARFPPYLGGVETHVAEVAPRLNRSGFDVTVLTTDPERRASEVDLVDGVRVRRVPAFPRSRDYYFAPDIYREVRSGAWDLVHLQGYHNLVAPLTMVAAGRTHIPYVVTLHSGGTTSRFRRLVRGVQRLALRPGFARASRIIAVSEFELDLFQRSLRLRRSRFVLIRNGYSMPMPTTVPDDLVPLVLSVGRLERYKGHGRLVAAWPHVQRRIPGARLAVAGSGPEEPVLRRQIDGLGLSGSVELLSVAPGDRQAMADLLGRAHLVTLVSDYEAHPVAVAEALAVGRPALVAESTGLRELVTSGLAAGVSPSANPQELADAVVRGLQLGKAVDRSRLPTWDDCAAQIGLVYEQALAASA